MTAATDAPSKTVDRSFLRFADLTDHRVIVLHTGELANRDANVRATLQRVHNEVLLADNPIDPEVEPEQTLFVSTGQLGEIIKEKFLCKKYLQICPCLSLHFLLMLML